MTRILLWLALAFAEGTGGGDAGVAVVPGSDPGAGAGVSLAPRAPAVPSLPTLLAPLPPEPPDGDPDDGYRLLRAKDGTGDLLYEGPGWKARLARDGSVAFQDKHVSEISLLPFSLLPFLPGAVGPAPTGVPTLETVVRGMGKKLRARRPTAVRPDPTADETRWPSTAVSRYRPDTREACQYPRPCFFDAPAMLVGVHAKFDVTDELMRLAGQDPYRYQKARFLTATRDLRVRLAGRAHAEDVSRSAASLPGLLQSIACDDRLSAGERRAIIEALRDELDVAGPEARAYADQIRRFLDALGHADGGARCPAH